jgi:hypothetical protein
MTVPATRSWRRVAIGALALLLVLGLGAGGALVFRRTKVVDLPFEPRAYVLVRMAGDRVLVVDGARTLHAMELRPFRELWSLSDRPWFGFDTTNDLVLCAEGRDRIALVADGKVVREIAVNGSVDDFALGGRDPTSTDPLLLRVVVLLDGKRVDSFRAWDGKLESELTVDRTLDSITLVGSRIFATGPDAIFELRPGESPNALVVRPCGSPVFAAGATTLVWEEADQHLHALRVGGAPRTLGALRGGLRSIRSIQVDEAAGLILVVESVDPADNASAGRSTLYDLVSGEPIFERVDPGVGQGILVDGAVLLGGSVLRLVPLPIGRWDPNWSRVRPGT